MKKHRIKILIWFGKMLKMSDLNPLTLSAPIPDEEKKSTEIFIFTLLSGASKGFMNALKAFIKLFQAPQRSVQIKI